MKANSSWSVWLVWLAPGILFILFARFAVLVAEHMNSSYTLCPLAPIISHPAASNNYIFFPSLEDLMVTDIMVLNIACWVSSTGMNMESFVFSNQILRVVRNPFYHHWGRLFQTCFGDSDRLLSELFNYDPDPEGKQSLSITSQ